MTRPSSIGHGVEFLNRHLSSKLFQTADGIEPLFQFLRMHTYRGQVHSLDCQLQRFKVQGSPHSGCR
jgi:sucrose synthase